MDIHQNARTTPASRAELVARVLDDHLPVSLVAAAARVCPRTVRTWIARYQAEGLDGLADRSSRRRRQPRATPVRIVARITALRLQRQPGIQIARTVGSRPPPSAESCAGWGFTGSTSSNRPHRSGATRGSIPLNCCTWTSRHSRVSSSLAQPPSLLLADWGSRGTTVEVPQLSRGWICQRSLASCWRRRMGTCCARWPQTRPRYRDTTSNTPTTTTLEQPRDQSVSVSPASRYPRMRAMTGFT